MGVEYFGWTNGTAKLHVGIREFLLGEDAGTENISISQIVGRGESGEY